MIDSIQPHWIALMSSVVLESPKAHMSSQNIWDMSRPDTSHIIYKIFIRDAIGEMKHVQALINCGATSIVVALRIGKPFGLVDKPAYITTRDLNDQEIPHACNS
jgi:hypothetical protein